MRSHQISSRPSHLHSKRKDHLYHHCLVPRISACQLWCRRMERHKKKWMSRAKCLRTRHRQRQQLNLSYKLRLSNQGKLQMHSHQISSPLLHKRHHRRRRKSHSYHHFSVRRILACPHLSKQMARLKRRWMSKIKSSRTRPLHNSFITFARNLELISG